MPKPAARSSPWRAIALVAVSAPAIAPTPPTAISTPTNESGLPSWCGSSNSSVSLKPITSMHSAQAATMRLQAGRAGDVARAGGDAGVGVRLAAAGSRIFSASSAAVASRNVAASRIATAAPPASV